MIIQERGKLFQERRILSYSGKISIGKQPMIFQLQLGPNALQLWSFHPGDLAVEAQANELGRYASEGKSFDEAKCKAEAYLENQQFRLFSQRVKVSVRSFLPWSDACVFLSAHPWGGHLVRPIGPSIDRLSFFSFSYGSDSIGKKGRSLRRGLDAI